MGNHGYSLFKPYHDIMLKTYLTAQEASDTLWHELWHAVQAERAGDVAAWNKIAKAQRKFPYSTRPIEIEARAFEATKTDQLLTF